jgi:hypothetical protein
MKTFLEWMGDKEERDERWLDAQRQRLMGWPLDHLIGWLRWADPNGVYSDEDARAEGMEPLDLPEAVELVMKHVEENLETPEEMRAASKADPARGATPLAWDAKGLMSRRGR